jgi:hypothetical protein
MQKDSLKQIEDKGQKNKHICPEKKNVRKNLKVSTEGMIVKNT